MSMKTRLSNLMQNELLWVLLNAVFAHTAFSMVIILTLQIPPEALLDTNMVEVLKIFEG